MLYSRHGAAGHETTIPVAVVRGEDGTTTLADRLTPLPADRYRVEKYRIAEPADIDGDCIDDLTELDTAGQNPLNPGSVDSRHGSVLVDNWGDFDAVFVSNFTKYVVKDFGTDQPELYFVNSNRHTLHHSFIEAAGIGSDDIMNGRLFYRPDLTSPDGHQGFFYYEIKSVYDPSFETVDKTLALLAASFSLTDDDLFFHIDNDVLQHFQEDLSRYEASRVRLVFDSTVDPVEDFIAMNQASTYGRLRSLEPDDRPHPRDIVIYQSLPNELSRVAGTITTVPQTPLSHVNLRTIQNGLPNAFIRDALSDPEIVDLLDSYVYYEVTDSGWTLRAATAEEIEAHYAGSRPATQQSPARDLSVTAITPLSQIGFDDWDAFGVKAANLAVLRSLNLPEGTVPDGYAIPFYFYDEFMKANGFYAEIETMLADESFQNDLDVQASRLKQLRSDIKDASTPDWITEALTTMHQTFPEGQSLRYRSSTNNEDLPGFNGAGLYDSKTQHVDETPLSKSLKQVYASLWNFRAFVERDLNNVNHLQTAMGVLVHPNYSDELANGVAVSFDPIYDVDGYYYLNTQIGEDLITNPDADSIPEEVLLDYSGEPYTLGLSNHAEPGRLIMSSEQMRQLRQHLTTIHDRFRGLYSPSAGEPFAIEIEFKMTSEDVLAIKQARPWVFGPEADSSPPEEPPAPPQQTKPKPTRPVTPPSGGGRRWRRHRRSASARGISTADSG